MMEWLNYHHLLCFWAVAKHGSIVRASEDLHLAHPTISGQIHRLEEVLGGVRPLDAVEKEYAALEVNGGNRTQTAAQLRIGTATLNRKLKRYGLIRSAGRSSRVGRRP
jgi:DNA-binding NtrC family response regulator